MIALPKKQSLPTGWIYVPKLGPVDPSTIESFSSDNSYTIIKLVGVDRPYVASWYFALFELQLPHWKVKHLPKGRKKLVPPKQKSKVSTPK